MGIIKNIILATIRELQDNSDAKKHRKEFPLISQFLAERGFNKISYEEFVKNSTGEKVVVKEDRDQSNYLVLLREGEKKGESYMLNLVELTEESVKFLEENLV